MKFNYNKNNTKTNDVTLLQEVKAFEKVTKKIIDNVHKLENCELCWSGVKDAIKRMDKLIYKQNKDRVFRVNQQQQVMNSIEADRQYLHKQARMGVGVGSDCKKHKKIIKNAPIVFAKWDILNKHLNKKSD